MSFNASIANGVNKGFNFAMIGTRPFPIHGRNASVLRALSKQVSNNAGGINRGGGIAADTPGRCIESVTNGLEGDEGIREKGQQLVGVWLAGARRFAGRWFDMRDLLALWCAPTGLFGRHRGQPVARAHADW